MGRNTREQNKVVVNKKQLKAAVWKANREMEIPSLSKLEIRLGRVTEAS